MLGLSALTAGTLAAGATGTLAWFTTNKTATAVYNNIKVQGTQGNLNVSIKGVTAYGKDHDFAASAEAGGESFISDVSSQDGLTFTQPNWKTSAGNDKAVEINGVNDVTTKPGYFTQYLVTIKNVSKKAGGADDGDAAASTALNVSLSSVSITGGDNARNWTRVAINQNVAAKEQTENSYLVPDRGTASLLAFFQNEETGKQYVSKPATDDPIPTTMGAVLKDCGKAPTLSNVTKVENFATLNNNDSIVLGVSVWLEGTLANTQDTAKGEQVAVTLTFTGTAA